jgi:hypothetical protein
MDMEVINMKNKISVLVLAGLLSGCSAVTATVKFRKPNQYGNDYVTGEAKVKARTVQEFRSLLEALEYRESEKAK